MGGRATEHVAAAGRRLAVLSQYLQRSPGEAFAAVADSVPGQRRRGCRGRFPQRDSSKDSTPNVTRCECKEERIAVTKVFGTPRFQHGRPAPRQP